MDKFNVFRSIPKVEWQRVLENPRLQLGLFSKIQVAAFGSLCKERSIATYLFSKELYRLYKSSGALFLGLYLKTCHTILVRFAAREQFVLQPVFVSCNKSGIPRIIPSFHRIDLIRRDTKSDNLIRFYLSLFSIYKIIVILNRKVSMKNIMSAPVTSQKDWVGMDHLKDVCEAWRSRYPVVWDWFDHLKFPISWSVSPTCKSSLRDTVLTTLHLDALSIVEALPLWMVDFTDMGLGPDDEPEPLTFSLERMLQLLDTFLPYCVPIIKKGDLRLSQAKLAIIPEAAGKTRLIAICNTWSQYLLNGYQDFFFEALRSIPQDGTFDQVAPLDALRGQRKSFCFDLSAATDRFPKVVQTEVIAYLLGDHHAYFWSNLLDFTFDIPSKYVKDEVTIKETPFGELSVENKFWSFLLRSKKAKFLVGQPLGARSSWAVFSFTHHMVVQAAALMAGVRTKDTWFTKYGIIGDDLILCSGKVARWYLKIMKSFGVSMSLPKVIVSEYCGEFAKKVRLHQLSTDVSPISCRLMLSLSSPVQLPSLLHHLSFRQVGLYESLRLFGCSYRKRSKFGKFEKRIILSLCSPIGPFHTTDFAWINQFRDNLIYPWDLCNYVSKLIDKFCSSEFIKFSLTHVAGDPFIVELLVGKEWMRIFLNQLRKFCLSAILEDSVSLISASKLPKGLPSTPFKVRDRTVMSRRVFGFWMDCYRKICPSNTIFLCKHLPCRPYFRVVSPHVNIKLMSMVITFCYNHSILFVVMGSSNRYVSGFYSICIG
uniref:RNA-dependent RNA polymerase n=1 Tax=Chinese swamp cypress mitovirus TaxID=2933111 RepID=A0A9C7LLY3_9VIRU|nr:RNA-dependent RNA polymerase [Chinese swamp cypress mitovirus]CAI5383941.1 RNA-dependent RNA polymerase [Chinese swamp cypress mitovirus]